jgi:hypothetical protein
MKRFLLLVLILLTAALLDLPPLVRKQLLETHLVDWVVVIGFFASWAAMRTRFLHSSA